MARCLKNNSNINTKKNSTNCMTNIHPYVSGGVREGEGVRGKNRSKGWGKGREGRGES